MAVVGTAFRDILKAMKQVIVDLAIPDTSVVVAVRMNPPATSQRKCLIIVPLYQTALAETQEGHGRCATYKKARVNVYYRHSTALDPEFEDDAWCLDEDGYYAVIDKLEDAFDLWHPRNAAGFLLREPARLMMDNEPRKRYDDHTWGEGMIELEMHFKARRTV